MNRIGILPALIFALVCAAARSAFAHEQPTTLIVMDVSAGQVAMTLHLPLSELEFAFGHDVTQNPEQNLPRWRAPLGDYLMAHLRAITAPERHWAVVIGEMRLEEAVQLQSGKFQEVIVSVTMRPPDSVSARKFTLHYDAIMHQVVTHKAIVSIRRDWERGQIDERQVGVIRVDTGTSRIEPLEISLDQGSLWAGFLGMIRFGMQHIKEGVDHLLFLLTLLLPAPLLASGNRWGGFGGGRYASLRLLKIVTAFTAGHSVTLLAGAIGWLRLPSQPVEALVAVSILVSALHALRPLFPGREIFVAAGFGLIHGLAFATTLTDLQLGAKQLALSILGFNLGIELMQLFVIALVAPWLILLSLTPTYSWARASCAALAMIAALGWIAERITGDENVIGMALQQAPRYAPIGILILALLALLALGVKHSYDQTISNSS